MDFSAAMDCQPHLCGAQPGGSGCFEPAKSIAVRAVADRGQDAALLNLESATRRIGDAATGHEPRFLPPCQAAPKTPARPFENSFCGDGAKRQCGDTGGGARAASLCRILFSVSLCLCGVSCTREMHYTLTHPDGTVEKFDYVNSGFDTAAGKIDVRKSGDAISVDVEQLDSQAKAMQLASDALRALSAVAGGGK